MITTVTTTTPAMNMQAMNMKAMRIGAMALVMMMSAYSMAAAKKPQTIVLEGAPPVSDYSLTALSKYLNVRSATFMGWLEDQSLLVSTRFGDTKQLHRVRASGSRREQVTFEQEGVRFAVPGPRITDGVIYGVDTGGGENYQLRHLNVATSEVTVITTNNARNSDPVWSNEGTRIAYSSTIRNGSDTDIYIYNFSSNSIRPLFQRTGTYYAMDWSPDDSKLLIGHYKAVSDQSVYIVDVQTGTSRRLIEDSTAATHKAARFAPDESGIWYLSDLDSEFVTLRFLNTSTGQTRDFTEHMPSDITAFDISPNGNTIAFVANEGGYDRLYTLNTRKGKVSVLSEALHSLATRIKAISFDHTGKKIGLSVASSSIPGDAFVYDVSKKKLLRWTTSELGSLKNKDLQHPQLIEYATFDNNDDNSSRRTIPAFYYKPDTSGPHPVLIYIHGGPESQARPAFSPLLHVLLNELGIAVIYPNVRGSSGYGKTYLSLDNQYKRRDAVKDIGALLDWISTQNDLDNTNIAVMGGSYGGYMSLASMTQYPDRFRAGISLVGISNFISFLSQTKDYRRKLRRREYGDEQDPQMRAFLERISPTASAHLITKPLLVAQGKNDPRVTENESRQIVDKVRGQGTEVWYLLATDEGHGFAKKYNRDYYYALVVEFLRRHLLNSEEDLPQRNPWGP